MVGLGKKITITPTCFNSVTRCYRLSLDIPKEYCINSTRRRKCLIRRVNRDCDGKFVTIFNDKLLPKIDASIASFYCLPPPSPLPQL